MNFLEAYDVENAEFFGGYYKPAHELVCENVDEIYDEEMLVKVKSDENKCMIVSNRWNFYGTYCRVDQVIIHTTKEYAMKWLHEWSEYETWTENLNELMYDTDVAKENLYLSSIEIE